MKELVKFELKKLFSNRLVYIVAVIIALFTLATPFYEYIDMKRNFNGRSEIYDLVEKYKKMEISADEYMTMYNDIYSKVEKGEKLLKDEDFIYNYYPNFYNSNNETQVYVEDGYYSSEWIDEKIESLKEEGKTDTYEYKNLVQAQKMISKLQNPKNEFMGDWQSVLDLNVAATMKIILLIVGLATIFSKEYTTKVAYINLSSKEGKTKLNMAKMIAAIIYSTVVFAFVTLLYQLTTLPLGLPNGNIALNSVSSYAIYDLSVMEYYVLSLIISYIGTVVFAILIVLLSLLTKNIIISFGVPLAVYLLSSAIQFPKAIYNYTRWINFAELIRAKEIFNEYISFNIFGKPILYPYLIIIMAVVSLLIMGIIYYKYARKQTIA